MRLLVHAVHNGEEENAKWVGPNIEEDNIDNIEEE